MKRAFSILLTLCILLTLAACGEPAATAGNNDRKPGTTTKPDTSVQLVTAYMSEASNSMGSIAMDFTYNSDYRGGTAQLTAEGQQVAGTFTCDENYNINHMEFDLAEIEGENSVVVFDCTFNDAHQLLSARIQVCSDQEQRLHYSAEYNYNSEGRLVYSRVEIPGNYISSTQIEFNEAGLLLSQTITNQVDEDQEAITSVMRYDYDENNYIQAIVIQDGDGLVLQEMPATHEIKEGRIYYTVEMGGDKMILVTDENGKVYLQENYHDGEVLTRIETTYDEAGRTTRMDQWFAHDNSSTVITYAYTADGRLQEHKQNNNGQELVIQRTTFQTVEIEN